MILALLYLLACGGSWCQSEAEILPPDGSGWVMCDPTATIETTPVDGGVLVVCRCPVPAVEGM